MRGTYTAITASTQTTFKSVYGWQFAETAGAAARVLLREGSVTGPILADIRLAASTSAGESFSIPIVMNSALYVEVNDGAVRGAVYGA